MLQGTSNSRRQQPVSPVDLGNLPTPLETKQTISCAQLYCRCKASTAEDCVDLMLNRTVFVTAMSGNHFNESYNLFGSIQDKMPGAKIIVYDLGLTSVQVSAIRQMCNVELRPFHFDSYPAHVHNLYKYAWKPLIINEVSEEYEIIVWADTSIRFKTPIQQHVFPYFLKANLTYVGMPGRVNANIAQLTHDGTISYFNLTRKELSELPQIQATFGAYWITAPVRKILDEWVDCAMHENCIAPKGATLVCRRPYGGLENTEFAGCHRFDQSALDLILYKHYGKDLHHNLRPVAESTCSIERADTTHAYKIQQC